MGILVSCLQELFLQQQHPWTIKDKIPKITVINPINKAHETMCHVAFIRIKTPNKTIIQALCIMK